MTRERRGRRVGCAQPRSYSGVAEGGTGRTRGAESSPSSSLCPSSSLSPRVPPLVIPAWLLLCLPLPTSSLASAVVDGDRVPMWHGRLFVEGGWRCQRWAALALSIRRGVRVGCRWFWGFDRARDVEGGCAAVFDGVRGVEGGWSADLGWFGLLVVRSGVSMAFAGWRVAV